MIVCRFMKVHSASFRGSGLERIESGIAILPIVQLRRESDALDLVRGEVKPLGDGGGQPADVCSCDRPGPDPLLERREKDVHALLACRRARILLLVHARISEAKRFGSVIRLIGDHDGAARAANRESFPVLCEGLGGGQLQHVVLTRDGGGERGDEQTEFVAPEPIGTATCVFGHDREIRCEPDEQRIAGRVAEVSL